MSYGNFKVAVNDHTLLDCFKQRVLFILDVSVSLSEIFEVSGEKSNHSRSGRGLYRLAGQHAAWVGLRTPRRQCILSAC